MAKPKSLLGTMHQKNKGIYPEGTDVQGGATKMKRNRSANQIGANEADRFKHLDTDYAFKGTYFEREEPAEAKKRRYQRDYKDARAKTEIPSVGGWVREVLKNRSLSDRRGVDQDALDVGISTAINTTKNLGGNLKRSKDWVVDKVKDSVKKSDEKPLDITINYSKEKKQKKSYQPYSQQSRKRYGSKVLDVSGAGSGDHSRSAGPNAVGSGETTRHTQEYKAPILKSTGRVNRETTPKVKRSSGIPGFVDMVHEQRRIRSKR